MRLWGPIEVGLSEEECPVTTELWGLDALKLAEQVTPAGFIDQ